MIRLFDPRDLGQCAAMYAFTMNSEPWYMDWSVELAYRYLSELAAAPRAVCVVAERDTELVAAAFCRKKTCCDGDELYIEDIFVQPEYQGQSIGSEILGYLEEYIMEYGMNGFVLTTDRRAPAAGFCRSNGFEVDPDSILMYKAVEHRLFEVDNTDEY